LFNFRGADLSPRPFLFTASAVLAQPVRLAMEFTRVINPVEDMEIWNASSDGFSFVISYESRSGPGFHGHAGFMASWRPIHQNAGAIKIGGSPFKTLADAEEACKAMLEYLTR
jgi:hypothetical protein